MRSRERLRVLQLGKFYSPHKGGMETYLRVLCNSLRDQIDFKVIVSNDGRQTAKGVVDQIGVTRVGTLLKLRSACICPGMIREIRETEADIVHIHLPNPTAVLAYLISGHKGRLVIGYHSDIIRQRVLSRPLGPVLNLAMTRARAVITTSPNYIESSAVLTRYEQRCHVIPFGVSLRQFEARDHAMTADIRRRHGPRIVLSVGRLVYYKGFEFLIEAMTKVDGRLLIVGDGPLRPKLQRQVERLGLQDKVIFLGEVEDLIPYYYAADVFVLASVARTEAFGIVQLEAMACAKPVVNTSLASGVPLVSKHALTGLTVPPGNVNELAAAISLILDDDDLRLKYGLAARRRVQQEFSLQGMIDKTLQVYHNVMGMNSASSTLLLHEANENDLTTGHHPNA